MFFSVLRILLLTSEFPPRVGGIASHVANLAAAFAALGHRVTVVAPDVSGASEYDAGSSDFQILRHQAILRAKPLYDFFLKQRLARLLHVTGFDVVHVHGLRPLRVALDLGLPVAFTNHTSGFLLNAAAGGARLKRTMTLLSRVDCLLAPSEELAQASRRAGYARPCEYIPNGVDVRRFTPGTAGGVRATWGIGSEHTAILAARRLVAKNGVQTFAEAASHLRDTSCRFIFAGDGAERSRVESTIARAGLDARAVFLGSMRYADMPDIYRAADLCVLPSLWEATSLAGLEAMACGKALIGSRVGGIPAIIEDGETGLLVPPADPRALANALRRLAVDRALRERMGRAGRRRAEQEFAWDKIATRTAAILERTARRRAAGRVGD